MIFQDQYDSSIWNKAVFCGGILVALLAMLWLMFTGETTSSLWLKQYRLSGDLARRILIAACLIIYFVRLQVTVWVFQKRKWTWLETITITVLISFLFFVFARAGGNNHQGIGIVEVIGMLLYLSGSYLNTHSEYSRHVWKLKAENQRRLYTKGLFSLSMHINYFGDIVLFTGLAMTAGRLSVLIVPLIMTVNFVFFIIPALDKYLEDKYTDEFRKYAALTKKLIPLIY